LVRLRKISKKINEQVFQNPNTLEIAWEKAGGARWRPWPDRPSEGLIGPPPGRLTTIFDMGCSNCVLIPKNPNMAHYGLKLIFMGKQRKSISSKSLDSLLGSKKILRC
jgi:hypothetical protein